MDKVIITAKTYDDAVTKALIELGTTQDNLDIKVLENGTNGLFGLFGAKPCKIEVSVIQRVDDFEMLKRENKLHSKQLIHSFGTKSESQSESIKEEKIGSKEEKKFTKEIKIHKPEDQYHAPKEVKSDFVSQPEQKKDTKISSSEENNSISFSGEEDRAASLLPITEDEAEQIVNTAEDFVKKLLKTMNFEVEIDSEFNYAANEIYMLMNSEEDMGIIIGKRGQTLDAIQYITSLVVNKSTSQYIRVKLDAQGYREKRKDKLENLANSVAIKVKRFRKPISLEPMNPYERRIIHSTLQNHPYITTKSEGDEPNRFITVLPKNNFSKNRYNKHSKFAKPQDRGYRNYRENRENQES